MSGTKRPTTGAMLYDNQDLGIEVYEDAMLGDEVPVSVYDCRDDKFYKVSPFYDIEDPEEVERWLVEEKREENYDAAPLAGM